MWIKVFFYNKYNSIHQQYKQHGVSCTERTACIKGVYKVANTPASCCPVYQEGSGDVYAWVGHFHPVSSPWPVQTSYTTQVSGFREEEGGKGGEGRGGRGGEKGEGRMGEKRRRKREERREKREERRVCISSLLFPHHPLPPHPIFVASPSILPTPTQP